MKIENVSIRNQGYVECKAAFCSAQDLLSENREYKFTTGINRLVGEVDSGNWAVSYLLSMYIYRPEDFVLFGKTDVTVNYSTVISLNKFSEYTCYMDPVYPMFSTKKSVRTLILQGLEKNHTDCTPEYFKDMFCLDDQRFRRPLSQVGNEKFRAMAAVAIAHGKQVFCFPWFTQRRFEYYHENLSVLLEMLGSLGKIVILPVGF